MLDITFIILTYNEEIHIKRALENITPIAKKILIIDCYSKDKTKQICMSYDKVEFIEHTWPGNQAEQFNWALSNVKIDTEWVFRLDADEYLTEELITELKETLPQLDSSVTAFVLPLGRAFCGKILKHSDNNGIAMIRLFKFGCAQYEVRIMDEHLKVLHGKIAQLKNQFIDDSRISFRQFIDKHNNYSNREAALLLDAEYSLSNHASSENGSFSESISSMRAKKDRYAKMPLFLRSFLYFVYRYVFLLGFLDGKAGFLYDFFQGLWYRMLVDAKVYEIKKKSNGNKIEIKRILKEDYNIIIK